MLSIPKGYTEDPIEVRALNVTMPARQRQREPLKYVRVAPGKRTIEGSAHMLKLAAIFVAVFVAELGDKTQLAVLLFAGDRAQNPVLVFLAASTALVVATGIAVLIGSQGARYLEMVPLKLIAGVGFIAIGAWSLLEHFRG